MKRSLNLLSIVSCLGLSFAVWAAEPLPAGAQPATANDAQALEAESTWVGTIDFIHPQESGIVIDDRMVLYSSATIVTRQGKGNKTYATLKDLKVGDKVRVTPLPSNSPNTRPLLLQIEILQ